MLYNFILYFITGESFVQLNALKTICPIVIEIVLMFQFLDTLLFIHDCINMITLLLPHTPSICNIRPSCIQHALAYK